MAHATSDPILPMPIQSTPGSAPFGNYPFVTPSMSATVQPVQRNRTLIDNEVQGGVLRKIAIHWILLFVCNSMALMIWLRLFEQPDANWQATFQETWTRFLPFFVVTCALIPAFVWDTLKLTHRFAGPISRLRSSLKDARDGKPIQPLKFRTNDYWREIADNFNAVVLPSSDAIAEAAAAQTPEDKTPAAESV